MISPDWLFREQKDPATRWHWIPLDIVRLISILIGTPLERLQGIFLSSRDSRDLMNSSRRNDLVVGFRDGYLIGQKKDGTILGRHRMRNGYVAVKISRRHISYYSQRHIYHFSHDFRHRTKVSCDIPRLMGKDHFYSLPVVSRDTALVLRSQESHYKTGFISNYRYVSNPKTDVCLIRDNFNLVLGQAEIFSQIFLNKTYAVWIINPWGSRLTIGVYHLVTRKTETWSLAIDNRVQTFRLVKHQLVLVYHSGHRQLWVFDILAGKITSKLTLTTPFLSYSEEQVVLCKNHRAYQVDIKNKGKTDTYQ